MKLTRFLACCVLGTLSASAAPIDDARALVKSGKPDEAITALEFALRASGPDKAAIVSELVRIQINAGRPISAQKALDDFLRDNPQSAQNAALQMLSAQLRAATGNPADALSIYRTLAEQKPPIPERAAALVGAIDTAMVLKNNAMADRSLTEFIDAFPKDPRARDYSLQLYRIRSTQTNPALTAEAARKFKAAFPQDPAGAAVMEFAALSAAGDGKGVIEAFTRERKLPTFVLTDGLLNPLLTGLRRTPEGQAMIIPLADEFAAKTGDPRYQVVAVEWLAPGPLAADAAKLGSTLLAKLGTSAWGPQLRRNTAIAFWRSKNAAEASRLLEEYLAENPADDTAWGLAAEMAVAQQRPELLTESLNRQLASLPARKNFTLRRTAQGVIRYRLALAAWQRQDFAEALNSSKLFLETDGLSTFGPDVLKIIANECSRGLVDAKRVSDQATAALKAAKGKDAATMEKAKAAEAEATAKLTEANRLATEKLQGILPSIEKYLTRTVATGASISEIGKIFDAAFATLPAEQKTVREMVQRVKQNPLVLQTVTAAPALRGQNARVAAEKLLPEFLKAGGDIGFEGVNDLINVLTQARVFDKVIATAREYVAKYPGATGPLMAVASSAQQMGPPKNQELPALVNQIVQGAGGSYWPFDPAVHGILFAIAEQNRQPAQMEAQLKLLDAAFPGRTNFEELRRIGALYAAMGDAAKAKEFLTAAVQKAQVTGEELISLQTIVASLSDSAEWALPLLDAYLTHPNRGPQQAAAQLLRAQLLATGKQDPAAAQQALKAALAQNADLAWNPGGLSVAWTEPLVKPIDSGKATPEQVELLNTLMTAYGTRSEWASKQLANLAATGQGIEFGFLLNRWIQGLSPRDGGALVGQVIPLAQQLAANNQSELATLVMRSAVRQFTEVTPELKAQIAQASLSLGASGDNLSLEIDPKSEWAPLLRSAASFRAGDPTTAWTLYQQNEKLFDQYQDKLPPDYLRWVASRLIQQDDAASKDRAEKILRGWMIANDSAKAVIDGEKAKTQFQLADLYFKTQRYDLARSEFQSLLNRFPGTPEATDAEFRIGECYLNQKMYVEAAKIFETMAKSKDKLLASRGEFLLGVLAQQRGDTDDAKARFRSVMDLAPSTEVADAILFRLSELYGQENRFSDELMLLRSIGLIGSDAKQWHQPGMPLNIVIQDADLGVSRGQSHVPVAVTTTSGDREVVQLESGTAGKGFFRAELPTELGAPKPGDNVLQVTGADVITYDYPDEFKKQFAAIAAPRSDIRLAADADFKISATEIREEQEISFEERLREERMKANKTPGLEYRQEFRQGNDLKPGNNIYLQVKDADRDVSNEPDTVSVRVTASSGSRLTVPLTETGPHTGIFRGTLPSAEVAAHVFASDSSGTNNATKAIDHDPTTAWEGRNDGVAPKSLVVDLKTPVKLGELKWQTPGGKDKAPTEFSIQTSTDLTHWKTLAATAGAAGAKPDQTARLTQSVDGDTVQGVANLAGEEARYVRFFIEKFSGGAPRIGEVEINDPQGHSLISDKEVAGEGDRLQLAPSDRITAVYDDNASQASAGKPRTLNQELRATYYDAKIGFIGYEFKTVAGQNEPVQYIKQVRRVEPGERVVIQITDFDADRSNARDTVKFLLRSSDGTETPMEARETEPYSGIFTKELDIWSPERPQGLKLEPGTELTAIYLDEQNTKPGAPTERTAKLEGVAPGDAQVAFLASAVEINKQGEMVSKYHEVDPAKSSGPKPIAFYPPLTVEVIDPAAAKDSFSEVTVTLTTSGGSKVDVVCPLSNFPKDPAKTDAGDTALEQGRFVGQIMLALGDKDSPATAVKALGDTRELVSRRRPDTATADAMADLVPLLNLNGQDVITAKYAARGKNFADEARVIEPAVAVFTDNHYEEAVTELYAGDKIYLSVKDLTADATAENDSISVSLSTPRGEKFTGTLKETLGHSGEFTGSFPLVANEKPVPDNDQLEVWFGDPMTLAYASTNNPDQKVEKTVSVVKGTDAKMLVFEKKYATEEVAIESQFRMAEAYFELFKNYRALKQTEEANTALKEGMQLLKELSEDYPSKAYEARTDYLLGQFAQELKNYDEAIAYYKSIVQNYGEHPLAADAQYKLGQCYEEKGDMDAASAEYVTLAYTWPEHPLVANVIVRIAEYFYNKKEFPTAAAVSKKFVERFPQHEWAEKMQFRAAQCWFKAEQYDKAAADFDLLVENYPRGKFRPDAIFWAGESYRSGNQLEEAFRRYKRVTWDYPESDAAKFARGKLVMPEMVKISDKDVTQ